MSKTGTQRPLDAALLERLHLPADANRRLRLLRGAIATCDAISRLAFGNPFFALREIETLLERLDGASGPALIEILLAQNGGSRIVPHGLEHIPAQGPVLIAATHPTGMFDFISHAGALARHRRDLKVVANRETERFLGPEMMIAVDIDQKNRATSARATHLAMKEHLEQDGALLIFGSGRVSNRQNGRLVEPAWRNGTSHLSKTCGTPVIPAALNARNSSYYYRLRRVAQFLSGGDDNIGAMVGSLRYPAELLGQLGGEYEVHYGAPLAPGTEAGVLKSHAEGLKRLSRILNRFGFPNCCWRDSRYPGGCLMPAPLPSALRARFEEYIAEGLSGRAAAARLKLSAATGVRWKRKLHETGAIEPAPRGRPRGHGKLAPHQAFLEELLAQDGDITLSELAGALEAATGVAAHAASIGRFLRKLGYTYKKKSLVAAERLRSRVKRLRQGWFKHRMPAMRAQPTRLVFIDETSVKTNLTRLRGRCPRGERLEMNAPFGAWGTQTFIAGLTHQSLIAPWVIKGAMDGEAFAAYIREVLAPELEPGTVVICDNLATHKNVEAAAALREHGCWFLYLPPYSPDLNPIEMAFAKLKAHLRRIGARTFDQMFDALAEVCDLFTPDECWNYFREAGYASN